MKQKEIQINPLGVNGNEVEFEIILNGNESKHIAKIENNQGIFGVEFPDKISIVVSHYPKELRAFVAQLQQMFLLQS
jgi:hypothetical protein